MTVMGRLRKIAIVLDSSHQISREMILGVIEWSRLNEHWDLSIVSGWPSELRLPNPRLWRGDGIIARIPTRRLATEVAEAKLPTVLIDPNHEHLAPGNPLAMFSRVTCDSAAVGGLRVSDVAERLHVTLRTLELHLAAAQIPIKRELERRRLASIEKLVLTTHTPLATIARQHGYTNTTYFTTAYKKAFGTTPAAARRAAQGAT